VATSSEQDAVRAAQLHDLELIEEQLPGRLSAENFARLEQRVRLLEECLLRVSDAAGAL